MVSLFPVVRFNGIVPSIGYTDFTNVYISNEIVVDREYKTLHRHECAHIWLQHDLRANKKRQEEKARDRALSHSLWNIACDLEIALHIYDDVDDMAITAPRSRLAGGIRKEDALRYDANYAEEFYDLLLENQIELLVSLDSAGNVFIDSDELPAEDAQSLIDALKEHLQQEAAKEAARQVQRSIEGFVAPRPSLGALIDRHIGRSVINRERTYRRPSRRHGESDLIFKGMTAVVRPPRMTLYVDRSGSFSPDKTQASMGLIDQFLQKYRGRIERDVIYFNDVLHTTDPMRGEGGTNYQPVIDSIAKDNAQLAIIITDADDASGVIVPPTFPNTIVVPVGCNSTHIAQILGAQEGVAD